MAAFNTIGQLVTTLDSNSGNMPQICGFLLQENGDFLLQENGDKIIITCIDNSPMLKRKKEKLTQGE